MKTRNDRFELVSFSAWAPATMKARELSLAGVRSVFFAMSAVLAVTLVGTYLAGNAVIDTTKRRLLHEGLEGDVQEAFSTLKDAETGQRGYLLTRRAEYLEPYESAREVIDARLRRLRAAADNGDLPVALVDKFERLTRTKMSELAATIADARRHGLPTTAEFVQSDAGKRTMDAIRATLEEIEAHEKHEREEIDASARGLTNLRTMAFAAAALVNLGFLAWAFRRIRREMARRYVADLEAQRHQDILAVSLASIGDAVIITDTSSRITFVNDVAVELTGWSREAALGQPCAKVFRIVDETTRAVVESPVELVLKTGKIVGQADPAVLIRKDGGEIPIDDSGAPVREADGALRGVVLVFRDFTHHKNAEREQAELKRQLEVANQAKDNFIAVLSHELRTPLTPVLATLSTWESGRALTPELAAEVKMLSRNVRLELRLIDDLLDLTRIARGQLTLHREVVDAHGLLAAVVEIFRADFERRQIRVAVRTAAERSVVEGDPVRLQQVFWNILGNAAKFTPDGGRIEIATSNDNGNLRVAFSDSGCGMSAGTLGGLFHPFEQPERPASRTGGLGIGLTISRNLMHAHSGDIEAASEGPGRGAKFSVWMPALGDDQVPVATAHPVRREAEATRPLSILLVEDHVDSAGVMARILNSLGHSVEVAGTIAAGLAALRGGGFDLVLSDIGLPDGTGLEFIAQARAFCSTPMIAITGYGMENDVAKHRDAGFLRQLTKPIRYDQLEEMIADFVRSTAG